VDEEIPMIAAPLTMLAVDRALPERDTLLDVDAVSEVLSTRLAWERPTISNTQLVRVNYQVGKSLRAVFRATIDGAEHIIAARMFREGRSRSACVQGQRRAMTCGRLAGISHAPELGCVFWLFPNDRKIDTLDAMRHEQAPTHVSDGAHVQNRLVAYAPEKSATFACEDDDRRVLAYAKVAAAHQALRDGQTYCHLRETLPEHDKRLRLPRPLAYDAARRTLWLEAISGRRLSDGGPDCGNTEDLERLGTAVAAFHELHAPAMPIFDRFAPTHVSSDAALLATVRPDVQAAATDLAQRLDRAAPSDAGQSVCLHGDLHPKNAILTGERVALIDVEDVATGPAAADVGSLLASMLYLQVCGRMTHEQYTRNAAAFVGAYNRAATVRLSGQSLAWHAATAMFVERAVRAVTRIRPLGLSHLGALIEESERLLDRGLEL
jgi:Ser/Thr protein kinase RdoA (MazF antagonist)